MNNSLDLSKMMDTLLNNSGIKTTNLDRIYDDVEAGTGTFKTLYRLYRDGRIKLLTKNGAVIGLDVDSGTDSRTKDEIAGLRFARKYAGVDVMGYISKILELKLKNKIVLAIDEDNEKVTIYLRGGEYETIRKAPKYYPGDTDGDDYDPDEDDEYEEYDD